MNKEAMRYQIAFMLAFFVHILIAIFLLFNHSAARPVFITETHNEQGDNQGKEQAMMKQPEIVHAVSVDAAQVQHTIEQLKNARLEAKKVEAAHQAQVKQELKAAQEARLKEQQQLANMKVEEEKIAIAHKQKLEKEKQRLKHLKEQKIKEMQALEAIKTQQEAMHKQHEEARKKAEAAEQKREAALKAEEDAKKRARLAGVVDKYKAMILNAISRQWILPEHVAIGLSSKFNIKLSADGTVLDVQLLKSSGDPVLDRSAKLAIYKASPLPVPPDRESFEMFREISLTVRPEEMRG